MRFSPALVASLFLPILVNAEHDYPLARTSETNINVLVAPGGQFTYSPSNFTASNGTVVTFFFPWAGVHSVTQGSFANPCVYSATTGANPAGFDSGLQTGKQYSITITNDQEAIWFFCKFGRHCSLGMVGAINAPTTGDTFDAYLLSSCKCPRLNLEPNIRMLMFTDMITVTSGVAAPAATGTPLPAQRLQTGSSTHLVANNFLALLAAVFGITLA